MYKSLISVVQNAGFHLVVVALWAMGMGVWTITLKMGMGKMLPTIEMEDQEAGVTDMEVEGAQHVMRENP